MAIRIMDSIKTANDTTDFPVSYAKDVWLDKNKGVGTADYSDLQTMYNNSELGNGGSSIQVDTMPIASAENENMIVEFIGSTGTYVNGYFYECVSDGEPTPTYSWVQKNVQPSNATATDVSYDNTTSELVATNVQDAIDEIKGGLGSASGKNFTDLVRPNSHELVESGSVYSAINNALSSIYTPRGELTCAELTSSLLIEDNVGNIYTMSDSGTTSALFINGAGQTINVNDNVGIIKAGANTYLFNLMGDAFDLHDYQKKELSTTIASATTVEGALSALNNEKVTKYNYSMVGTASLEDDIKTFVTALIALGANTYVGFFNRSGNLGTAGNYSITVYAEEGTSTFASGYIALGAGALGKTQYIVSYYKPTGSSEEWTIKKIATTDWVSVNNYVRHTNKDLNSVGWYKIAKLTTSNYGSSIIVKLTSNYNYYNNSALTFCLSYANSTADCKVLSYSGANNVFTSIRLIDDYVEVYYAQNVPNAVNAIIMISENNAGQTQLENFVADSTATGGMEWNPNDILVATTENLTNITLSDYQLQVGGDNYAWFDLGTSPSTSNAQAYLFYEITYGRVDGLQSKILVSCGGTMADGNYIKIVNLNNAQTSASEQFKIDSNKHLWLGMQSYCDAHVKVYGRWSGMGGKTTIEPIGTILPIYKLVTESDISTLLGATAVKVAGYSIESSYVKQGRVVTAQIQFWGGSTLGIQINDVLYTGFPQPDRGFQFSVYNTEFSEPIVFQLNEDGTVITKETISKDSTTIGMFSYISKY